MNRAVRNIAGIALAVVILTAGSASASIRGTVPVSSGNPTNYGTHASPKVATVSMWDRVLIVMRLVL